jgi:hypothetical protein
MTKMNRGPESFANSLLDAPDLSSVLYMLYWNLPLNATALRDLGDLRSVVKKEEARRVKEEQAPQPFGDGDWDASIIHNDG